MFSLRAFGLVAAMSAAGCTGEVGEALSPPGGRLPSVGGADGAEDGEGGGATAALACAKRTVGSAPIARLTRAQYRRTVEDLLAVTPDVSGLPAGDTTHGYEVARSVSSLMVEAYAASASAIAAQVSLAKLAPCDPAKGDEACATRFIETFARRAFRRASREDERARLLAVYRGGAAAGGFAGGLRLVVEAVLQSPSFVYHVDQTNGRDASGLARLGSYALANRLSYLVWGSMPDDALLDAAAAGMLDTNEGLASEARRLMAARPDATRQGFREFTKQWLSLDLLETMERDAKRYPAFSRAKMTQLGESLNAQIDRVVWDLGGGVDALLRDQTAFVNTEIASLFGATSTSPTLAPVALDASQRRGILTHPALLSVLSKPNQSDPVLRGKFIRERMLCQHLAPPPPDVATVPPDPKPGLSTRARFAEHSANQRCAGCHKLMDPIGFGLEHFDALGAFRSQDEGVTIDARGEIVASKDESLDGAFDGALALADKLAGSKVVQDCVATQYVRFALGRTETDRDVCSLESTLTRTAAAGGSLKELIVALVQSDAFRFRTPEEAP
ncbi:MAG: DUF1588 domain-containing protein [Polyangiales bacterium]